MAIALIIFIIGINYWYFSNPKNRQFFMSIVLMIIMVLSQLAMFLAPFIILGLGIKFLF